jgi:hypothetical protein
MISTHVRLAMAMPRKNEKQELKYSSAAAACSLVEQQVAAFCSLLEQQVAPFCIAVVPLLLALCCRAYCTHLIKTFR